MTMHLVWVYVLTPHTIVGAKALHAMVATKNENNLFTNRFFGPPPVRRHHQIAVLGRDP